MIDEIKAIFQTAIDIHTPSLLASDASSAAAGDASSSLVALWPGPELQRRDIVSRARHALEYIDMQTREYFADLVAASSTMRELAGGWWVGSACCRDNCNGYLPISAPCPLVPCRR